MRADLQKQVQSIAIGMLLFGATAVAFAQTPELNSVNGPNSALSTSVPIKIAGNDYGSGVVNYGPVGTPLQLNGEFFGSSGEVLFQAYVNGSPSGSPVQATVREWTQATVVLTVPAGATTGLIEVQANGQISNGLPFVVMPGTYSSSCPVGPPVSQLQITSTDLPDGTVNVAYSTAFEAEGFSGTLTWSLESGTLPTGLSLNSSGVISGTPTSATSSPMWFTIAVTDSGSGQTATVALDISVASPSLTQATIYSYTAKYDHVGNVTQYQDSVMGTWNFTNDTLNRLETAVPGANAPQSYAGQNLCFAYDGFGNRTAETLQSAACPSPESSVTPTTKYNSNNWVTATPVNLAVNGFLYDVAGDVYNDNLNQYLYDPEGRVCAVKNVTVVGTTMTGYLYDAEGNRVAKGTLTTMSCDPGTNGFQLTETYVVGQSGQELSMLHTTGSNTTWQRSNVYGAGRLLATYDLVNGQPALHFQVTDPLGTRRQQTNSSGTPETACQSLPYGDGLTCFPVPNAPATADDATPLHFTAKERDPESGTGAADSGNDYFVARYYGSSMGRFLSPDDGSDQDPEDPQSWDLYSYVRNNPLTSTDPDGHSCGSWTYRATFPGMGVVDSASGSDQSGCPDYSALWDLLLQRGQQAISNAAHVASQFAQSFTNIMNTPGGAGCLGKATIGGGMAGGSAAALPGLVGLAGGPTVLVTEPGAIGIGTVGGGGSGFMLGMTFCQGGASSDGGRSAGTSEDGRPRGVPENWKKVASRNGMDKWADPSNPHNYVRVRTDGTITQVRNGWALDAQGNEVLQKSPAAHFPASEWVFRP